MIENCIRPAPDCFWCPSPGPSSFQLPSPSAHRDGSIGRAGLGGLRGARGPQGTCTRLPPSGSGLGWLEGTLPAFCLAGVLGSPHRAPTALGLHIAGKAQSLSGSGRELGQDPFLLSPPLDRAWAGWRGVSGSPPAAKGCGWWARASALPAFRTSASAPKESARAEFVVYAPVSWCQPNTRAGPWCRTEWHCVGHLPWLLSW